MTFGRTLSRPLASLDRSTKRSHTWELSKAREAVPDPVRRLWNVPQYTLAIVSRLCLNLAHTAWGENEGKSLPGVVYEKVNEGHSVDTTAATLLGGKGLDRLPISYFYLGTGATQRDGCAGPTSTTC